MNLPRRRITLLALFAVLLAPVASLAQQGQKGESDEAFMSRMERQLNALASRAENLDRRAREGTHPDLRSLRLKTRSVKKRIDKERERMAEQYRSRDEVEFDRDQWGSVVRRFERELTQMERGLRPF
ncbi:MAG: hypothetical protein KJO56_03265 [Gammaproteobacteria bacterium]|nr:hypothetical protein [Gammaproteobacteria bacterium]